MKTYYQSALILIFLFPYFVFSQNNKIDSLRNAIPAMQEDTAKVDALLDLSSALFRSQPDTAIIFAQQAIELAQTINYPKGYGYALKNIGLAYYIKSDFPEVLNYWQQSLDVFKSIGDQLGISNLNNNIGAVHFNYGDDPKALEYYLESLKAAEKLGSKIRIGTASLNIGTVYYNKPVTHDKALTYYLRAVSIFEEEDDLNAIGTAAVNLGEIYSSRKEYNLALTNFEKALSALEKAEGNISYVLTNLGKTQRLLGNYNQSIAFHEAAVNDAIQKNDKRTLTQALIGQADTYFYTKNYSSGLEKYLQAEKIANEIGSNGDLEDAYKGLAQSYAQLSNYNKAFDYQNRYSNIRDTLYNAENTKMMTNLQFQFDLEKKEAEIELLKKDNELNEATIESANNLRNFLFAVAAFLVLMMGGIYYQFRFAQRKNKIISEERNRAENILLNILPADTAEELKMHGSVEAKKYDQTSVLFTDFKEFTRHAEDNPPEAIVKTIDFYFTKFDEIITKHELEKIKTIGDAYMCVGGLPVPNKTNAQNAVRAALEIIEFVQSVKDNKPKGVIPFDVRIGINTGPVIAGVVGSKKFQYDIWGNTVNIAARMESGSHAGKVNISENTYDLVKGEFECEYRGEIEGKNSEKYRMYFVDHPSTQN